MHPIHRLLTTVFFALAALPAWGQIWDTTGNSQLTGSFYFRDVIYYGQPGGVLVRATMSTGTLTFSGNGTYTGTINVVDSALGTFPPGPTSGTYSIAASGHGFMSHPVSASTLIHGTVSGGVFLGSSTEGLTNDLMIMVPATPAATASIFTGAYSMAYLSVVNGNYSNTYNSMATLNPNGAGNVGTVPVKTYIGNQTNPINQNESGVTYNFAANGVGTLRFPTTSQLALRGDKSFFITPNGDFFFGGALNDFDFFVGVRRHSGTAPAMEGLYYSAGVNHIPNSFDTFYGAFKAVNGTVYEHQRFLSTLNVNPVDYSASLLYPTTGTNEYTDDRSAVEYVVGRNGNFRIGIGQPPYMTLRVATRGPVFATVQNNNPFIDPTGVVNSASYAPFTAGIAHGELVAIFGQNLSAVTQAAVGGQPFPKTMGGVQVKMNNRDCAIYYVSPGVISAQVPYGITDNIIQIQVIRDGVGSNFVTAFRHQTAPGVFTLNVSGIGLGAIRDINFQTVNEANPTRPGADIQVYMTGLGDTFPVIEDGGIAPTSPLAEVVGVTAVDVDFRAATVQFDGLTPTVAGLYQVNLRVPDQVSAGDVFVTIRTSDAETIQATTHVTTTAASEVRSAEARPFHRWR